MITKHLQDCIKYIPKDRWFEPDEIPTPVSRNNWVCRRLVEEGILEDKIEWAVDKDISIDKRKDFRVRPLYHLIESK